MLIFQTPFICIRYNNMLCVSGPFYRAEWERKGVTNTKLEVHINKNINR